MRRTRDRKDDRRGTKGEGRGIQPIRLSSIVLSSFVFRFRPTAFRELILLLAFCLAGCSSQSGLDSKPGRLSFEQEVSAPYDQIEISKSLPLDALPTLQRSRPGAPGAKSLAGTELISRSASAVASVGQTKDGQRTWFNMVKFEEFRLNVIRKYFLLVDERSGRLRPGSRRGLRFDCRMIVDEAVLAKSYSSEYVKQIALLSYVMENLRRDANELGADIEAPGQNNRTLSVLTMLMNQTFEMILLKLDSSPMLTARLGGPDGARFDHINFDQGTVRLTIDGDIVTVEMRFGSLADSSK